MNPIHGALAPNAPVVSRQPGHPPKWTEWCVVAGLLLSFLAFHAATYNWYPVAWSDEATYSEPAINLAQDRGFTTSAWQFQPSGTFWAVNPPLYGLVLSLWLRITGTSLLAVRSFNFSLFALAVFLVWVAAWRFRLIRFAPLRLVLLVIIELGYGINLSSRSARPDVLGMLGLVLLFLAFSIRSSRQRGSFLFLIAMVIPWTGLHVALYTAVVTLIVRIFHRGVSLGDLLCVGFGLVAGGGLLAGFLAWHHAFAHFQTSVHVVTQAGGLSRLGHAVVCYFKDLSCLPLILATGFSLAARSAVFAPSERRIVLTYGLVYLAVPVVFCLAGDFRAYYAYMIYVPLVLGFGCAWSESKAGGGLGRPTGGRIIFVVSGIAAILVGLPLRLGLTVAFCDVEPRAELENIIASRIGRDDVVFSEDFTFFETKRMTPHVYVPFSAKGLCPIGLSGLDLTAEERSRVNVMIVKPDQADSTAQYFGGKWTAVGAPFGDSVSVAKIARLPAIGWEWQALFNHAPTARFQVQIFRRIPGA